MSDDPSEVEKMIRETYAEARRAGDLAACVKLIESLVKMRISLHPVKESRTDGQDPDVRAALTRINGKPSK